MRNDRADERRDRRRTVQELWAAFVGELSGIVVSWRLVSQSLELQRAGATRRPPLSSHRSTRSLEAVDSGPHLLSQAGFAPGPGTALRPTQLATRVPRIRTGSLPPLGK